MKIHRLAAILAIAATTTAGGALAQARAGVASPSSGFYGGISLRQDNAQGTGLSIGAVGSAWGKYAPPMSDDATSRALLFGGYRFANDVSVEASFGTADRYALRPEYLGGRAGVGLSLLPADPGPRAWNADVYTSWSFLRRFALYGRMGYAQADNGSGFYALPANDPRRVRDGVNYGVGVRYDVNPALGLRVEYARFGRFAGEVLQGGGVLPESDQVQLGVQLRF